MGQDPSVQGARTVEKALEILNLFGSGGPALSLAEIASGTELPQPTARRLVKALRAREFLVVDSATHQYRLGPAVVRLFGAIVRSQDFQVVALAEMEALRSLTGETVAIYWLFNLERVCIMEVASEQPIRMGAGVGRSFPLYAGASGKAILSTLPDADVEAALAKIPEGDEHWQPKPVDEIRAELAEVRRLGYARSLGETVAGAAALAAPLRGPNGRALGALNITAPVSRAPEAALASWVEPLRKAAATIEMAVGYVGTP